MNDIKITNNSAEFLENLHSRMLQALHGIGKEAVSNAAALTPVVTGNLKNSMTYEVDENNKYVIIGTNVKYAPFVENGSSRNKHPAHMLKKAAIEYSDQYKNIAETALKHE